MTDLSNYIVCVVIGIGSIEQHGPHLSIQTDALAGDIAANRVATELGNALQAPTIRVGCSDHHLAFPGTISCRKSTLKAIIHDYVESLARHGFENIILLPSHGGNFGPTQEAIEELQKKHPKRKIVGYTDLMGLFKILADMSAEFGITAQESGAHAGENETSLMLALREELVKKERLTPGYIGPLGVEEIRLINEKGMTALTDNGVLGDPTKATREKGEIYVKKLVTFFVEEIQKQLK
ncbi:MAG: creatininase family protein [Candidatus Thorarchaeota archaeon]